MRGVKEEHSHPEDCLNDDRLSMDGGVVHEKYHWASVVATVSPHLEDQIGDEVLEHRSVDTTFNKLNGHDLLLADGC